MTTVTRESIIDLLNRNPKAVERAMVVLYERQTADEQVAGDTKHSNGIGFSGVTARQGTYFAQWVKKGRRLTDHHLDRARKIAITHVGQLVDAAKAKAA